MPAVQDVPEAVGDSETQIEWVQQVRDLGPLVWLFAAAAVAVWYLILGAAAVKARPRRVTPGPDVYDPPGDEPPALVNLLTNHWNIGKAALSATVVDLAARGYTSIYQGTEGGVSVHVPASAWADTSELTPYERMVYDHLEKLAEATPDRVVPAAALTTGEGSRARAWWSRFRGAVVGDAKARGLARRRWSGWVFFFLFVVSVIGAIPFGIALATAVYADHGTDGDIVYGAAVYSVGALLAPGLVLGILAGKRQVADTEPGRAVAMRWLGLRSTLGRDPILTESDASGASVWGRKLAYGAALGVAHGAVTSVPLGPENKRELWSTTSGMWRVVRVRYSWPGSYGGHHPGVAVFGGLLSAGPLFLAYQLTSMLDDDYSVAMLAPVLPLLAFGAYGAVSVLRGLLDLLAARRTVEGEVLRVRQVGSTNNTWWHVVVDDGMSEELRAWRVFKQPRFGPGTRVRADLSRWLRHARDPEVVVLADGTAPGEEDRHFLRKEITPTNRPATAEAPGGGFHIDIDMALKHHAEAANPDSMPDAASLTQALGLDVYPDTMSSAPDISNWRGTAVSYVLGDGRLQIARLSGEAYDRYTRIKMLHREVDGVAQEALRLKASGTLLARNGQDAVMVVADVHGMSKEENQRVQAVVAQVCLASFAASSAPQGSP